MNLPENIEKLIKDAAINSNPDMNRAVLKELLQQFDNTQEQKQAVMQPNIRRTIMKSPIVKLAAAAVIIGLVVLGLFELTGTKSTSSVVWADVVRKVEASRGSVVRNRGTCSFQPSNETDYSMIYASPKYFRKDVYKGGQVTDSYCTDFESMTYTSVSHTRKHYLSITITPSEGGFLEENEDWMNPRYIVQTILSCVHRELGQKTIEGILCEGLETNDPAVFGPLPGPVTRLDVKMRLWVNAETKYPVLFECKVDAEAEGQSMSNEGVMDQFQWDVELDPSFLKPNIPPDYVDMRTL
jgi:hypothetical protein